MKGLQAPTATVLFLLFINVTASSQKNTGISKMTIIEPCPLMLTVNKTTNLIFPFAIKSVDRGSRDVLAQKAKGVENILLLKAGRENFAETNVSVITADGKLYSFLLNYSSNPALLNLSFAKDSAMENSSMVTQPESSIVEMERVAQKVAKEKKALRGRKESRYNIRLRLNGLYIQHDIFYFQVEIRNRSNISYGIDMLRFFVKDERKYKRTASQEIELQPLYVWGDTSVVKEQSQNILVFALPKFTIPDKKFLFIQLMEKAGGRNLSLHIHNRTLLKTKSINQ